MYHTRRAVETMTHEESVERRRPPERPALAPGTRAEKFTRHETYNLLSENKLWTTRGPTGQELLYN